MSVAEQEPGFDPLSRYLGILRESAEVSAEYAELMQKVSIAGLRQIVLIRELQEAREALRAQGINPETYVQRDPIPLHLAGEDFRAQEHAHLELVIDNG